MAVLFREKLDRVAKHIDQLAGLDGAVQCAVDKHARENGEAELPASQDTGLDAPQQECHSPLTLGNLRTT